MTRRLSAIAIIALTVLFAALGAVSVARQLLDVAIDPGFSVVGGAGTIEVAPDSEAALAGLRSGDRLVAIDGEPFRDPFAWNRGALARARSGTIAVEIVRGSEARAFQVPVRHAPSATPWFAYLALVGFFFLATGTLAALRQVRGPLNWRYYAFSLSVFSVLAFSDTPATAPIDWVLFLGDRLGRLSFGPLFLLLAFALARLEIGRPVLRLLVWAPSALLGMTGVAIVLGAGAGRL